MPSLERFFNPQMRVFSANITSLPSARLYFFQTGSTTPKVTYADKQGLIPNENPVIASSTGSFPPIFLDGLYRVELRSSANIVQPGWPIDNVGQDSQIVPYAPWSEIVTYAEFERVTDLLTGIVYRSKVDNNLGNVPASSPSEWEVVIDPVPSSFTSDAPYFSWSDDGGQISLDVDQSALIDAVEAGIEGSAGNFNVGGKLRIGAGTSSYINNLGQISKDDVTYYDIAYSRPVTFSLGASLGSVQMKMERLGSAVTFTTLAALSHVSAASVSTAAGIIPAGYRPSVQIQLVFEISSAICVGRFSPAGAIDIVYYDFAGVPVSRTGTSFPVSGAYAIT